MIVRNYMERCGVLMSKDNIKNIHLVYGCITALHIVIVGIALIVSCLTIYGSGERPFSREVITLAFSQLAIPGLVCLALVVGGIVLQIALPLDHEKAKGIRSEKHTLLRYAGKYAELSAEQQKKVSREISLRHTCKIVTAIIIVALAVYPVLYFADWSHFGVTDLNGDILSAVLIVLIPTAMALALVYLCTRLELASIRREIDIYKENSLKPEKIPNADTSDPKKLAIIRAVLMVAAVVLIILGIANDGVADVLGKAIRICTECIGLG